MILKYNKAKPTALIVMEDGKPVIRQFWNKDVNKVFLSETDVDDNTVVLAESDYVEDNTVMLLSGHVQGHTMYV